MAPLQVTKFWTEPSPVPRPPPFTENVSPPTISYQPPQSVPVSPLLMPGQTGFNHPSPTIFPSHGQPLGQVTGTTSGSNHFTLSPTPQSFTGPTNGTAGWSDARPVLGSSWDSSYLKPTGFPEWSTSGLLNLPALSPSVQSSSWNSLVAPYQTQPHPVSRSGSPAYCFHCMQFGGSLQCRTSLIPMKTTEVL